mgnify:CR=1 FL=1
MRKTNIHKITKLKKTISNHVYPKNGGYNGSMNNARTMDLVDRYNDLVDLLKEEGTWEEYCLNVNSAICHDGYDLLA